VKNPLFSYAGLGASFVPKCSFQLIPPEYSDILSLVLKFPPVSYKIYFIKSVIKVVNMTNKPGAARWIIT